MPTFLVTGATGRQGGSTARQLLQKRANVHALVRDPNSSAAKAIESEGATLFEGDAANATAIAKALDGVTGVFYNPPYPGPEGRKANEIFIQTCAEHKDSITTFVVSTACGVEKHAERLKKDPNYIMSAYYAEKVAVEDQARAAGFQHLVILRASFLMHNYLPPTSQALFQELAHHKLITALQPETAVPHLVAEDVGNFAAAALLEPSRFSGRSINLAAENLTAHDVAQRISDVSGVKVEAPIATFEGSKAMGVESPVAPYHQWANEVDASVDVAALKAEYAIPLTRLEDFLAQRKAELMKALGD